MAKRPGYIFTNKRHSKKAIMSTILGIISIISLVGAVIVSYFNPGENTMSYGMTGVLITIFAFIGLILGIITVSEKDRYRIFPILGVAFNLVALCGISIILYAGAYLS